MKVRKKTDFEDEKSKLVFRMFDRVLGAYGELPFDVVFYIGGETEAIYDEEERKATLIFNYYDKFVREGDEKGIWARLMYLFYLASVKQQQMPEIIDEIIAGRRMAVRYPEELFYTMYIDAVSFVQSNNIEEQVIALIPYFIFSRIDKYNAGLLFSMVQEADKFKSKNKKLFAALESNLGTEKSVINALNLIEQNEIES